MINVTSLILYILVEIATAQFTVEFGSWFCTACALNGAELHFLIVIVLHDHATLRLLLFSKLRNILENHEDETGANDYHDSNDNEHDYQEMVDLFDFCRIIFWWPWNQQFWFLFLYRLGGSVIAFRGNLLLCLVGLLALSLNLQITEGVQVFLLDRVHLVDDVPIYFFGAWWRRK